MPHEPPPDIVLLGAEWHPRVLLRAQLIEEGFDVVATNTWPMMRRHLRPGAKPRLALVDLSGLPEPQRVLNELRVLMKPNRVLVLAAIGTVQPAAIERFGFRVLRRPVAIKDVMATAVQAIRRAESAGEQDVAGGTA
jgi:hypothetical protein